MPVFNISWVGIFLFQLSVIFFKVNVFFFPFGGRGVGILCNIV